MGYWLAGFDIACGVDIEPQRHFPFELVVADVRDLDLVALVDGVRSRNPGAAVVVTSSPPCQRWSAITPEHRRAAHPDLVDEMRRRLSSLLEAGLIDAWVIENVEGAPLVDPVRICGEALGLEVRRHRLFESSHLLEGVPCAHRGQRVPSVVGGYGGPARGRYVTADEGRAAMGAEWLPWPELVQSIPPAYTEHLGLQAGSGASGG